VFARAERFKLAAVLVKAFLTDCLSYDIMGRVEIKNSKPKDDEQEE
jgi:hypothetical protein